MKFLKQILLVLTLCLPLGLSAQNYIQAINANMPSTSPTFSSKGNAVSGAKLILDALGGLAQIKCQGKLENSLKERLEEAKRKYSDTKFKGKTIKLMALVNNSSCQVYGYVQMDQIIRVKENTCSIDDIHLVQPGIIFDPYITSFFVFQLKIE